ncbi:dienelactone hydrolase [Deinobacterium chartae]|uniref:Dienelactone hydrolase n=1 Tax=Deinobacterium chartae TaxID=521158 RepID=A0A841HWZ5_9DEIO|nr:dienelactone hydrolase family protein [Deinobacterium chartae]MBB6097164.1 dienelactone hydrolase [Deinobacterium chartae]
MRISQLVCAALMLVLAPAPRAGHLDLFAYDASRPPGSQVLSRQNPPGMTVHEITYSGAGDQPVTALLLVPPGPGPFAGMLFMHGAPGTRRDLLQYAEQVVARGVVALLPDAPFARNEPDEARQVPLSFTLADREHQLRYIIDLRRGLDLLTNRTDVDPSRLGCMGFSYGATMGALLAGVEPRLKACALVVGGAGVVSYHTGEDGVPGSALRDLAPARRQAWVEAMQPLEPVHFVGQARAELLLQNGRADPLVKSSDAARLHSAAGARATVEWYETGHAFPREARASQLRWLSERLALDVSP